MKKVAFATSGEFRNLTEDDRALIDPLKDRNIEMLPLLWDDPEAWDRNDLDMVIVRSCWNYHLKSGEFLSWARRIENSRIALWNPSAVIEWNHDKHYLHELALRGIRVVPTVWVKKNESASLRQILRTEGWEVAVVKPAISATAFQTWVISSDEAEHQQHRIDSMLKESGLLVQRLLSEVQTIGEWSFLFFNGKYSHAVLKHAQPEEFRVQEEYGGTTEAATPPPLLLKQAEQWIEMLKFEVLYARLDAVEVEGSLVLMELELIEPALFLKSDPRAPERFAEAISLRLRNKN